VHLTVSKVSRVWGTWEQLLSSLLGQAPVAPPTSSESSVDVPQPSTPRPALNAFRVSPLFFTRLWQRLQHQVSNLFYILQWIYIPSLLCWPVYYADQASSILGLANDIKRLYGPRTVIPGSSTSMDQIAGQPTSTNPQPTEHIELQAMTHDPNTNSTENQPPNTALSPPPYSPTTQSAFSVALRTFEGAWVSYIDARTIEWRISTTTACVFVA
jgi:hypothetical protein